MKSFLKILFFLITLLIFNTIPVYSQLVPDFRINDDLTNRGQYNGRISIANSGQFIIVWEDYRNNNGNIYGQRFTSDAVFSGSNFKINLNPDSCSLPAISVSNNGNFTVSWLEINCSIPNSSKMKCRLFKTDAVPITGEILLNDSSGNFDGMPSIGVNGNNEFIIVWEQKGIRFQKIDSIGNKIGVITKVNDYTGFSGTGHPAISIRQDDSFIITWEDTRPPGGPDANDIYFQMFDRFGNKIGINQKVNDDLDSSNQQRFPKISSDTLNKFIIGWSDNRESFNETQFYAQSFLSNGNKEGINFRIYSSPNKIGALQITKKSDGKYLAGWDEDIGSVSTLFFQRFDSSNSKIGNSIIVSSQSPLSSKIYSDVKIFNDKIISVWNDTRNDPFDVYCKIRSFANPDTTVNIKLISHAIPENFILYQNYPNPFNSSTSIRFNVKHYDYYKLEIFNYLGQSVVVLFNQHFNPGTFQITFESFNLSSGLYYYVLSSQNERLVKSLVLLK